MASLLLYGIGKRNGSEEASGNELLRHGFFSFRTALLLLCLLCLFGGADVCRAQLKNVNITVYRMESPDDQKLEIWPNIIVYGFFNKTKADIFYKRCMDEIKNKGMSYSPLDESEYDALEQTDVEGKCLMQLPLTGFIVVKPEGADPQRVGLRGRTNVSVKCVAAKVMGTVTKTAKRKRKSEPAIPNMCGNRMVIGPYYYYISADDTNDKSRIIISPMVKAIPITDEVNLDEEREPDGKVIAHLAPFVKDGVKFQQANLRRMGFDETRDPLFRYRDGTFMRSHEEDSILVTFVLEPVSKNIRYKVDAMQAYGMNTNEPYRMDSVCLSEGYVKDPMRFLDYSLIEVPIERRRYERRGRAEFSKDHEKLDLKFVVGEARLDPTDTLNFKQLNQLKDNMSRYMGADAGITSAVIHGSASPEGGYALNERLCRERAEYLRGELSRFPALQDARKTGSIQTTHKVATWTDVANLLEADSLKQEAASVRGVIATTKDMRRQEAAIRQLPCWNVIEQQILPQLRIVDIEYQYYTNRVKTRKEIWEQYQNDPGYHAGRKQVPYEFYELLDMIKDPKEKEVIARAAYNSVKDEDGLRQWPLAAYELAQCYARRGMADTTLLKPYIDDQRGVDYHKQKYDDYGNQSWDGWYNDEAIFTTHIKMLANAGAFASAYRLSEMVLPDTPEYRRLKLFLRCLNCEWNDPEVMDTVSASSYWNKIVMLAAQEDDPDAWGTALYMLDDVTQVDPTDPKSLYLKGQLRFNLEAPKRTTTGYQESNFVFDEYFEPSVDDPTVDMYGEKRVDWGLPMIQCCLKDEKYVKDVLYDGTFNKDYRKAFKAYWKKLKADPEQQRRILEQLETSVYPDGRMTDVPAGDASAADSTATETATEPTGETTEGAAAETSGESVGGTSGKSVGEASGGTPAVSAQEGQLPLPVTPVPAAVPATVPAY